MMSRTTSPSTPFAGAAGRRPSPARQRLIGLLHHVHFGRVLDLHVHGGEPLFDPPPRVVRTVKLAGAHQPPRQTPVRLTREINDLLQLLDRTRDGVIGRIEVAHGLPLFAEVHESA